MTTHGTSSSSSSSSNSSSRRSSSSSDGSGDRGDGGVLEHAKLLGAELAAGVAGGCAKLVCGLPFDSIKVRCQAQRGGKDVVGPMQMLLRTVRQESFFALYKGASAQAPGLVLYNAMLYGSNNYFASLVGGAEYKRTHKLSKRDALLCGSLAGVNCGVVCCPVEMVRSRLQLQRGNYGIMSRLGTSSSSGKAMSSSSSKPPQFCGAFDVLRQVYRSHGIRGVFRGLNVTMLREVPANAVYFSAYEAVLRHYHKHYHHHQQQQQQQRDDEKAKVPTPWLLLAGACAGVCNWAVIYPIDSIKTRYSCDDLHKPKYASAVDCFRKTVRAEGWRSLFRGITPCLLRGAFVNAIGFYVVDEMRALLT
jgi:solute carrier family 25 carnitine/acylcarnitine transporter 20/29